MTLNADRLAETQYALQESEERFRLAIGAASVGIWDFSPPTGRLIWDERVHAHFGVPLETEPSWDLFASLLHPDDKTEVLALAEACLQGEFRGEFSSEYRIHRADDGVERWITARGQVLFDEAGAPIRFLGTSLDSTERKQAEEALRQSEARHRFLADMANQTQSLTDADEIMQVSARLLGQYLGAHRCAYAEVEADENHFQLTGNYTDGVSSIVGRYAFSDFGETVLRLMRENRPYVIDDVDSDPNAGDDLSAYRKTQIQAVICVPLHKQGKFVAAMAVHQRHPRSWTADEVELVRLIAGRCWESLERARVARTLRESEQRHRFLSELATRTQSLTNPDEVMAVSARALGEYLNADRCAYAEIEPDEDHFLVTNDYTRGVATVVGRHALSRFGEEVVRCLRDNRPFIIHDRDKDPKLSQELQRYGLAQIRALAVVPLHKEGKLTAVFSVHMTLPHDWSSDEIDIIRQVADRSWEAIERARITRRLAEHVRRMEILNRTGAALAAELDLERLIQTVTDAAVELTGASFGAFFYNLIDDNGESFTLYTLSGAPRSAFADFPMPRNTAIFNPTFMAEGIVRSDNIRNDSRYGRSAPYHGMPPGHLPVCSYLAVPVVTRYDEVIGGLFFGHEQEAVFTENSELIAKGIAAQAAIAIDNAKLYQASRKAEHSLRELLAAHEKHQRALAESEARLRIAAGAAQLGIFEWVMCEDAVHWENDRMYEIFDRPRADGVIPTDEFLHRYIHPDDAAGFIQRFSEAIHGGGRVDARCRIRPRPDQTERWLHFIGTFDFDQQGHPNRFIGTVADITDRKAAEDALRLADRRKDEFLAILAHELRNPLAPLRNAMEILQQASDDSKLRQQCLAIMGRQMTQMVRLIDDLLDISRISIGKIELRKSRTLLQEIVHNAVEIARPLIEKRRHRLSLSLPQAAIDLEADKTRLAQVLSNLLNNAAKYTPPSGEIELSVENQQGEALIRVKDNGIGIAPEQLGTIFEMFVQVERTTEQAQGGLGIGLTLSRRLIELHGGRLEAHSQGLGAGSEFIIRLPLSPSQRDASTEFEPVRVDPAAARYRILVVDDNVDAAESLAELLRLDGHSVHAAYDGASALTIVSDMRPHIVLMDIGMPSLDGYETARRMRLLQSGRDIAIVAVTGWGQEKDVRLSKEAGFDHHLVKPVDFVALRGLVRRHAAGSA